MGKTLKTESGLEVANGYRVSFGDDKNILKPIVRTPAQL